MVMTKVLWEHFLCNAAKSTTYGGSERARVINLIIFRHVTTLT